MSVRFDNKATRESGSTVKTLRSYAISLGLLLNVIWPAAAPAWTSNQQAEHSIQQNDGSHSHFQDASFRSDSLQREMKYRVFLPRGYETSAKRYPVLYLLHGLYGDFQNWSSKTNLASWAENLELIIAMPDAGNSWYVNSATNESDKFEDYIVRDFVAEVDSNFRTIRERRARGIAGLSMGGYAAMNLSLKHPQLFSFVGAISAALDAPVNLDERKPEFRDGLQKAFGPHGSGTRTANDVLAEVMKAEKADLPYFYMDCGEDDLFLIPNRQLAARLQGKKVPYEYHEFPGDHTWEYWDQSIRRFLLALSQLRFCHS
jgi:putative tributyrin esterase